MSVRVRRSRHGGVAVTLDLVEHHVLRRFLLRTLELLDGLESDQPADDDPLARAVEIGTATEAPADPALARLFPDAYADDPEASGDFRRYTEPGLRTAKREALETTLETLGEEPGKVVLSTEQAEAWLGALNDTRLVLGERLGITEDIDAMVASLDEDDPRLGLLAVWELLSYLQESVVGALSAGP